LYLNNKNEAQSFPSSAHTCNHVRPIEILKQNNECQFLSRFLVVHIEATTICSLASWEINATTVAGSSSGLPGSTSELLSSPVDVFMDNNGTFYISDWANYRVQQWLPNASNGTTVAGGSLGTNLSQFSDGE